MIWLYKRFRDLWSLFSTRDSARQLAWGVALGLLAGLVPKGNLTSFVLITVMFSCRINLAVGVLCTVAFSWFGLMLDPLSHALGKSVLTAEALQPLWKWLFNLPIVPWTSLHNTVVMGSLIIGLALVYPTARLLIPPWQKFHDWQHRRAAAKAAAKAAKATSQAAQVEPPVAAAEQLASS